MTKTAKDLLVSTKRYEQMGDYATMYEHGKNYRGETDCSHYVKRYSYKGNIVAMADMKHKVLMTSNYGKGDTRYIKSFIEHYVDGLHFRHIRIDYEAFMSYEMPRMMYRYTDALEITADVKSGVYREWYKTYEYNSCLMCLVDLENEVFMTSHGKYKNHEYVDRYIESYIEHYTEKGYKHIDCDALGIPQHYMCYAMWNIDSIENLENAPV